MLFTLMITVLLTPFRAFFTALPFNSNLGMTAAANAVFGNPAFHYLAWINWYFPLSMAITLFTASLGIFGVLYLFDIVIWIWKFVTGGAND